MADNMEKALAAFGLARKILDRDLSSLDSDTAFAVVAVLFQNLLSRETPANRAMQVESVMSALQRFLAASEKLKTPLDS